MDEKVVPGAKIVKNIPRGFHMRQEHIETIIEKATELGTTSQHLVDALNDEGMRAEASESIRALIDEVRLVPKDGTLKIELYGELAALLSLGQNKHPRSRETGVQVTLVAGARSLPFRTPVSTFIAPPT